MADEVGRFVASIEADPSGLSEALKASAAQINSFANSASRDFNRANESIGLGSVLSAQGLQISTLIAQHRDLARTIQIEGAQTAIAFRESSDSLASQLVKLGATEKELDILGRSVKTVEQRYIAMATAATTASQAQRFGTQFLQTGTLSVPTVSPGQLAAIASTAKQIEQVSVASSLANINLSRLRLPLTTLADHMLGLNRATGALASGILSLGIGTAATVGLVAGVAAIGFAYDKLTEDSKKAREEMEKLKGEMNSMVDVANTLGLQSQLQKIQLGDASKGVGAGGAFKGSLVDLQTQLDKWKEIQKVAGQASNFSGLFEASKHIRELSPQVAKLQTQYDMLAKSIREQPTVPTPPAFPRTITVTAHIVDDAKETAKFISDLQKRTADILSANNLIAAASKAGQHLPLADFSAAPLAAVNAYNDAARALKTFNLTLDQQIKLTEDLQRLQALPAVIVDQARQKFGPGNQIVIPPVTLDVIKGPSWAQLDADLRATFKTPIAVPLDVAIPHLDLTQNLIGTDLRQVMDRVRAASQADLLLQVAVQVGTDPQQIAQLRAQAAQLVQAAQAAGGGALKFAQTSGPGGGPDIQAIARIQAAFQQLNTAIKDIKPPNLGGGDFAVVGRGVLDIADAFGVLSNNVRKAATGMIDAIDIFNKWKADRQTQLDAGVNPEQLAGLSVGQAIGIAGGIAAVVSSLASVLTADDAARAAYLAELQKINDDNIAKLGDIAIDISGALKGPGKLGDISVALKTPALGDLNLRGFTRSELLDPSFLRTDVEALRDILKKSGVSFAEIDREARDLGITLFDSAGNLIPSSLKELDDAIRLTVVQMTHFQNTLQDQRSLADLNTNVFDIKQSPIEVVDSWLDTFKKLAPSGFSQIFGGVDIHNAAAVKKAEQDWVLAVENGTIDLAKLGITKDDFISIINGMEQGFDSVTGAANALSQSLRNVPEGFKVAAFEFAAAAVEARRFIGSTPTSPSTPTSSIPVTRSPVGPPPVNASFTLADSIVINVCAAPGDDPEKISRVVFNKLRIIARTTGDDVIKRFVTSLPQ